MAAAPGTKSGRCARAACGQLITMSQGWIVLPPGQQLTTLRIASTYRSSLSLLLLRWGTRRS
eukprot:1016724-Lingulodinium_polyedra.AAC.1